MNVTDRARTRRAHIARKNAHRRLNDPMLRAAVLAQVFGKQALRIVEEFHADRAAP